MNLTLTHMESLKERVKQFEMDNEFNLKNLLKTNSFEIGKILKLISTN
jgi:hypothetical protein